MNHIFTDNEGRKFAFEFINKKGLSSSLEIKNLIIARVYRLYFDGFYSHTTIREDIINDELSWHQMYPSYPEELRVYLKKFIKLLAFS